MREARASESSRRLSKVSVLSSACGSRDQGQKSRFGTHSGNCGWSWIAGRQPTARKTFTGVYESSWSCSGTAPLVCRRNCKGLRLRFAARYHLGEGWEAVRQVGARGGSGGACCGEVTKYKRQCQSVAYRGKDLPRHSRLTDTDALGLLIRCQNIRSSAITRTNRAVYVTHPPCCCFSARPMNSPVGLPDDPSNR